METGRADEAQIGAILEAQQEAWNRGDAEAYAAHFLEDGSFTNILGLGIYEMKPGKPASMILLGGAGFYESDFGINGGIGYRKFMSPELALAGGARAHWVFSGTTFAWLQLFFGVQYFFGK